MPDYQVQARPPPEWNCHVLLSRARASSTGGMHASSWADLDLIHERLLRISALTEEARLYEAREASAELLFDFQPLIAAHPGLLSRTLDALSRCEATALRRLFLVAVHGDCVSAPVDGDCVSVAAGGDRPAMRARETAPPRSPARRGEAAGPGFISSARIAALVE
jgi:hypothetical protein